MNKKFLLSLLLIVLLTQTASAAFTLTWNEPTANTSYNNTPMNRQTIDLNFTLVDNNASVSDINIQLQYWHLSAPATKTIILSYSDWNAVNYSNASMTCFGNIWASPGKSCTYRWTMPLNTVMDNDTYLIDANVISTGAQDSVVIYDKNATVQIYIDNKLAGIATLKSMLVTLETILVAAGILIFLGVWFTVKPDPASLAKIGFGIALATAMILLVMGTIIGVM